MTWHSEAGQGGARRGMEGLDAACLGLELLTCSPTGRRGHPRLTDQQDIFELGSAFVSATITRDLYRTAGIGSHQNLATVGATDLFHR